MALHGKTKIELFKNGKPVLVHEEGNLVTNKLRTLLNAHIGPQYLAGNCYINREEALGGLLLFRQPIDEDADNWAMPGSDNLLTGRAYENNSVSGDLDTGTYNTNLSYFSDSHIHLVWDFDEEHGNGPISCAALTGRREAQDFRKFVTGSFSVPLQKGYFFEYESVFEYLDEYSTPVFYDADTDIIYCISRISASGTLAISKYDQTLLRPLVSNAGIEAGDTRIYWYNNRSLRVSGQMYSASVGLVDLSSIISPTGEYSFCLVDNDGYAYILCTTNEYLGTNEQVSIAKVNLRTAAVTTYTLTNYSNYKIRFAKTPVAPTTLRTRAPEGYCFLHNGYFLFSAYTNVASPVAVGTLAVKVSNNSQYSTFSCENLNPPSDAIVPVCERFSYDTPRTSYTTYTEGFYHNETKGSGSGYIDNVANFFVPYIPLNDKEVAVVTTHYSARRTMYIINLDSLDCSGYRESSIVGGRGTAFQESGSAICGMSPSHYVVPSNPLHPYLSMLGFLAEYNDYSTYDGSVGGYFWIPMCRGLQTINNLDTQIVKTADLTMRVTYDLEEEAPSGV